MRSFMFKALLEAMGLVCMEKLTCSETVSLLHPKNAFSRDPQVLRVRWPARSCTQTASMPPLATGGLQQRGLPGAGQELLLGTGTTERLIKDGALGI